MVAESIQSEGGSRQEPRPRRYYARPVMRGDDEGFVVCECAGCSGCGPPCRKPALWWLERADEAMQLCGTCANRRTSSTEERARVLRRLDAEPESEEEDSDEG